MPMKSPILSRWQICLFMLLAVWLLTACAVPRVPSADGPKPSARTATPIPTPTPGPQPTATPQPTQSPATPTPQPEVQNPIPPSASDGYYTAVAVINDASCPGNYILGQVQNTDGAPVAGVHVVFVDQWGNRGEAVTKNGANDYGNYDFPIGVDGAREIRTMVVDGAGNPISPAVVIERSQDSRSDAPCHHVVWRAN